MNDNIQNESPERLQELWKLFWIEKLGYYPTKVEKVIRKVIWEEANKEKTIRIRRILKQTQ